VRPESVRELSELADAPIQRALEGALVDFKSVARVQRHDRAARIVHARF
jgi:hypothetical protein